MALLPFRSQIAWRQSSSESQTGAPRARELRQKIYAIDSVAAPIVLGVAGLELARPGEHIGSITVQQIDIGSPGFGNALTTDRTTRGYWRGSQVGGTYGLVEGALIGPAPRPVIDNGTFTPQGDPVATCMVDAVALSQLDAGTWEIQVDAEPLGLLDGVNGISSCQIQQYIDTSTGAWPNVGDVELATFLKLSERGDGRIDVGTPNVPIYIPNTCGAFNDGDLFILPGDVGTSDNQISTDPADLSVQRLQAHPTVFVRRSDAMVEVTTVGEVTANPPAPLEINPPRVWLVDRAPLGSWWDVLIDGSWRRVLVLHTIDGVNMLDLRRPRDIYSTLISYYISTQGMPNFDYTDAEVAPGLFSRQFYLAGFVGTVSYSQAWRFRGYTGAYNQDGSQPPPLLVPLDFRGGGPGGNQAALQAQLQARVLAGVPVARAAFASPSHRIVPAAKVKTEPQYRGENPSPAALRRARAGFEKIEAENGTLGGPESEAKKARAGVDGKPPKA